MSIIMTKFIMTRDINGYNGFGLPQSNQLYSALLLSGVAQTFTVPQTGDPDFKNVLALFNPEIGTVVWVAINNGTATIPTGAASQTNSESNPASRLIKPGSTISVITSNTSCQFGLAFYATY